MYKLKIIVFESVSLLFNLTNHQLYIDEKLRNQ